MKQFNKLKKSEFETMILKHYQNVSKRLYREEEINLTLYYSNNKHIATWQKKQAWMEV